MTKPTLTPVPPLQIRTSLSPEGHPVATLSSIYPWQSRVDHLNATIRLDLKTLHSLAPVLALLDEAVALDDSNVSPNATICKLREVLSTYREIPR